MRLFSQRKLVDSAAEKDARSDPAAWHFYDI